MQSVGRLSEQLKFRLKEESKLQLADRMMMRQRYETQVIELDIKRDEVIRQIDMWAAQQKASINALFSSLVAEIAADHQRNEINWQRSQIGSKSEPAPGALTKASLEAKSELKSSKAARRKTQPSKALQSIRPLD